jgi:hydroxyethylthiazole kinase-like sugar kinase family protein
MTNLYQQLYATHQQLQQSKPLILNLTNYVTQDFMANVLLALVRQFIKFNKLI